MCRETWLLPLDGEATSPALECTRIIGRLPQSDRNARRIAWLSSGFERVICVFDVPVAPTANEIGGRLTAAGGANSQKTCRAIETIHGNAHLVGYALLRFAPRSTF